MRGIEVSNSSTLLKFAESCAILTPILIVYCLEAPASLQVWKVAQHVPPPSDDPSAIESLKKLRKRYWVFSIGHVFLFIWLLCAAIAGYLLAEVDETSRGRRYYRFYLASLSFPLWLIVTKAGNNITKLTEKVLFRDEKGKVYLTSRRSDSWTLQKQAVNSAVSALIVYAAVSYQSNFVAALVGACMLLLLNSLDVPRSFTAKNYILVSLMMVTYFALLSSPYLDEQQYFDHMLSSPEVFGISWQAILIGSLLFSTPLQFIAACYRFDFANANNSTHVPMRGKPQFVAERSIIPINSYQRFSQIVFKKPYFASALCGWACSSLAIAALHGRGVDTLTYAYIGIYNAFISPLVMVVAIGFVAGLRDEMKKVWAYKEEWGFIGDASQGSIDMREESPLLR